MGCLRRILPIHESVSSRHFQWILLLFLAIWIGTLTACGSIPQKSLTEPLITLSSTQSNHTLQPTQDISKTSNPAKGFPVGTPIPTLSDDEQGPFIASLIARDSDCKLPCLWGLTPGKSDFQSIY
jgi:hypothetical protein